MDWISFSLKWNITLLALVFAETPTRRVGRKRKRRKEGRMDKLGQQSCQLEHNLTQLRLEMKLSGAALA